MRSGLVTWAALAAFLVAVALGAMVPGPTTALVVRRGAVDGFRAAVPLVLGIEAGLYTWIIASAVGVAAVVAASETAYTVLRFVGAGVLLVLGIQAWLASLRIRDEAPIEVEPVAAERWWRAGLTGAVTQLSNPKVAVFMVAFFPQFIPATSNVLLTTLLLGLVEVVVDGGWYLLLAIFAGKAGKVIVRPKFRRTLERATGTVLIGLGVRMAVSKL
jgi:threonine/homoserine/homoserine lactone efflux protein